MAQAYTRADSIGLYNTIKDNGEESMGGSRGPSEIGNLYFLTDTPHPQLAILSVSGTNGEGVGTLTATDDDKLTWTPPGGTAGSAVTIAANETKLIEGSDADQWIRVHWDGDYSTDTLGGSDDITLLESFQPSNSATSTNSYSALMFTNHSGLSQDITNLKIWLGTLGTQRTTNSAQLSSSGAGTITTTGSFADWPAKGWAHIKTSGGSTREIVYYSSRTNTSLTVPSAGRGLLGTTAAAGSSSDTIDAVPGVRIAKETQGSDGRIQEVADNTTAPTGVSWSTAITSATGLSETTLASNANLGLWIHGETPAVVDAGVDYQSVINFEFTVGGTTYTNTRLGRFQVKRTAVDLYEVYAGIDADPDLDAAPAATSATLPITYALTPPVSGEREYRITLRKRNAFNLVSQNTYTHNITIDSTGALVGGEVSAPQNTTIENVGSGKLRVRSYYPMSQDSSPADTWIAYVTTDGSTPDPSVDTPISFGAIGEPDILTGRSAFDYTTAALPWNTTLKAIIRVQRASDSAESTNVDVVTATADSDVPAVRNLLASGMDQFGYVADTTISNTVHNASPAVNSLALYGQTVFKVVSTVVFRATVNDAEGGRVFVNNLFSFVNSTISGSGTGDIEVVDANTVYLNVGGNRQCLIDLSANTISAAEFRFNQSADDNPKTGPIDTDNGKLYLSVYNTSRNTWEPYLQVSDSGVVTFNFAMIQKET